MRFSQRQGVSPVRQLVQLRSMDDALRNGLWNVIDIQVWRTFQIGYSNGYLETIYNPQLLLYCTRLWIHHFKEPLDQMPTHFATTLKNVRLRFMNYEWFEVYDFVEFTLENFDNRTFKGSFATACNQVFQTEMSGYRFVGTTIVPITDAGELKEIEEATADGRAEVVTHLRRAAELLSDRKSPDYRNSVKESISAVESLVISVIGKKGTLGKLIKKLESEIGLHPALEKSFDSLYGYTSDQSGIRHALMDGGGDVDFADAKLMLVLCSTFVNFVEAKLALNAGDSK